MRQKLGRQSDYIDAGPPSAGAWFTASRLGRCPHGGWCTSSCSYDGHGSTWKQLVRHNADDIDGFLAALRRKLRRGENHAIDISRHDGDGFENWRWITRGEDIEDVDAWIEEVRGLLAGHLRLRLYGDSHPEAA